MSCYVLGLSAFAHESSACLLKDGVPVAFCEEERFNRQRHTDVFPIQSIRYCLKEAGIQISAIAKVTFFWKPWLEITGNIGHVIRFFPESLGLLSAPAGTTELKFLKAISQKMNIGKTLQNYFPGEKIPSVFFCEHHLAHAASAFYSSPFEHAAILTLDGRGESVTTLLGIGHGINIEKIGEIKVPHSLGHFYSSITHFLGFRPFFDEWKVMGLSAFGTDRFEKKMRNLIRLKENGFELNLDYFQFYTKGTYQWLSQKFIHEFSKSNENDFQFSADIAWAAQKVVEMVGVHLTQLLRKTTNEKNLVMAGGVVLNCLMNHKIIEESGFENFYFQPVANDAGTSLGSAQYWYHCVLRKARTNSPTNIFLGPAFSNAECLKALELRGLKFAKPNDLENTVAQKIADGKVIGWFQGRMECGPRALGARSILADPGRPEMKDRINRIVKRREVFRPFAPAVLTEMCSTYFEMPKNKESPYMILTGHVLPDWRDKLSSITHVDGTARVQTVDSTFGGRFYRLIKEFGALSGYSVLLNTSFNESEPIVCTPEDAIACFFKTEIDVLVLQDFIVEKKSQEKPLRTL